MLLAAEYDLVGKVKLIIGEAGGSVHGDGMDIVNFLYENNATLHQYNHRQKNKIDNYFN